MRLLKDRLKTELSAEPALPHVNLLMTDDDDNIKILLTPRGARHIIDHFGDDSLHSTCNKSMEVAVTA